MIIGGSVTGFALLIVVFVLFVISLRYGTSEKKSLLGLTSTPKGDQELAVLRTPNLGINGTIVNNTIYEIALADDDLAQLPKIDKSQITRGKFIGKHIETDAKK